MITRHPADAVRIQTRSGLPNGGVDNQIASIPDSNSGAGVGGGNVATASSASG